MSAGTVIGPLVEDLVRDCRAAKTEAEAIAAVDKYREALHNRAEKERVK